VEKKEISTERPPIGRPEIIVTKLAPGNEFAYTVKLALLPSVTLPDVRVIARRILTDKKSVTVTDEEVDKTLFWLRESRSPVVTVERAAASGDTAEIDFEVHRDGVRIESGESKNHPLVIGKNKFMPGFDDHLIGMRSGEEKKFTLVAPEHWHEKSLAGKSLEFRVAVKSVQERMLPELNDEFAKSLGTFETLEALKKNITEGMTHEKEEKEKQRIRASIIEVIAKESTVEIPDVLIVSETEKMVAELKQGMEDMGMKWEDYLLHIKKTIPELQKEWRPEAEKRVRIALCLGQIARQETIEATEEEITARANQMLEQYKSVKEAEKAIDPQALREYCGGIIRNEKVFELLEKS